MFRNLNAEQARRGLTDEKVADFLGMSRGSYSARKQNGRFTLPEVVKLLRLFNCDFEYLFSANVQLAPMTQGYSRNEYSTT